VARSSTARFISYDLRPAKQSERRILIDILKIGGDCGLPIDQYRYVGMGANRFYDFLLLHKYLGISTMTSLEHDPEMFKRAVFNVPYGFIDVQEKSAAAFVGEDSAEAPSIYWLDYDGGIGPDVVGDISSFSSKLKIGDFCFITVFGGPPRVLEQENDQGRLVWLQDNMGDLAGEIVLEDVERSNFTKAIHKLLIAAFRNAFSPRRDGVFVPLLQVEYSDSTPMVTVGGALLSDGQAVNYRSKIKRALPFLNTTEAVMYHIKSLNLTERERVLFDRAVTSPSRRRVERNALKRLGFKADQIAAYKDLVRYLPRYVETIV
jgi:hypothetical protein